MLSRAFLPLAALLMTLMVLPATGLAADPVFPPGSRIGLVPPAGMLPSKSFTGFEDPERKTAILLAEFPTAAYFELEKQIFTDALRKQGVAVDQRRLLPLGTGMGILVSGRLDIAGVPHRKWFVVAADPEFTAFVTVQRPDDASEVYTDDAIRASLSTLALRVVPKEEQLEHFPVTLTELGGFPHVKTLLRGVALLLSDGTEGILEKPEKPYMVISLGAGPPPKPEERSAFAQRALGGIQGYKDLRIVSSEAMRIVGMSGHELRLEGKHEKTDTEVMLVQWLRFGPGGFVRMVGVAQKKDWPQALARFRAVRDGIKLR